MKKVLLKSMLLFVAVLFAGISTAQTVSGTVTEESGPLPGANVIVKGTQNGATTDFDGNFTLTNVPSDATLVFSYVGYASQEVAVGGRSTINVNLAPDNALDEIVVIGYGSTTIKDATGSVASVTSEEFNRGVIQSPEQLIQGKTAGVQVSETSGEPGGAISIRIRGSNSIRSNNNPLFVVDGVPLTSSGAPQSGDIGLGSGGNVRNPLSFLNPNDIESISILKDASATAIYGSRGANGVVIIQTKGGRGASKGVWEINTSVSGAVAANEFDLLNRDQYIAAVAAAGNTPEIFSNADTDFQDFYTRTAFSRRTNLSYSKSYDAGNLRGSFGYINTFGVVEDTDQEVISGRLNAQHRFFDDKLTLSLQGTLSRVNDQTAPFAGGSGSRGDIIGASLSGNPTVPLDPNFGLDDRLNPVNLLNSFRGISNSTRYLVNLSADYKLTDEFSAKATVGYDRTESETFSVFSPDVLGVNGTSGVGRGSYNTFDGENSLLEITLNYKKEFNNSKLDLLGGFSYQEFVREGINATGAGFGNNLGQAISDFENTFDQVSSLIDGSFQSFGFDTDTTFVTRLLPEIDNTGTIDGDFNRNITAYFADTFNNTDELQSFFVRGNYTIADKYIFTGTFRADGSSTFGEDNRYGFFPSGAFAWQLAEEDFVSDAFSTLKLRLGFGIVGSQEGLGFGQFLRRNRFAGGALDPNSAQIANIPGTVITGNANDALQWEETTDFNVGIDFGFINDRLNGSINIYRKETNELLLNSDIAAPSEAGVPTLFSNLDDGTVVNQGIELGLNYDWIDNDDWSLSTSFNIAFNQNEVQDTNRVIDLAPVNGNGLTGAFAQRLEAGQPLFAFFLAEFLGFDDQGNPLYTDFNGDGVGDPDSDRRFTGDSGIAEITSGFSLNARYKRISLSTTLNGQFGFSVYNNTANALFTAGGLNLGGNVTPNVINADFSTTENPAASTAVSDRFLEDGDFVRLQSATLSYDWPLSREGLFDSLILSLTGQNLFIITDYSGLDPEVSINTGQLNSSALPSAGIDYLSIPRARTVTVGVNARF